MSDDAKHLGPKPCSVAWMRRQSTGVGATHHQPDAYAPVQANGYAVCKHCGCVYWARDINGLSAS